MSFEPLTPERRRAMTRRYLLDAAEVVFVRDGFYGATLDKVASLAGFTKGAVYSNFKNKEDLFLELLDDRFERQVAVISEALDEVPHVASEQLPRVRELFQAGMFFLDEAWTVLWLEFVLYARRNPTARAKLAVRAQRERLMSEEMMATEYAARDRKPPYPLKEMAKIALAIFNGLSLEGLIEPDAVTDATYDTVLALLYNALDVPPADGAVRADQLRTRTHTRSRTRTRTNANDDGQNTAKRETRRRSRRG